MIDWYGLFFERSKKFYFLTLLLFLAMIGASSFGLYKYFDKAPALRESIFLHDALDMSNLEESKNRLLGIIARKNQPYGSIAAMHLARLLESPSDNEKKRELYTFVSLHASSTYIRELAQLNLQLMDGNINSHGVYGSTSQFLDAMIEFIAGRTESAQNSLSNVAASVDVNPYIKALATRFLDAIAYQNSFSTP